MLTLGKAIAGGVPIGAFGLRPELGERLLDATEADVEDTGGIGGTLAGNALSTAAMRATLSEVLTAEAFVQMIDLSTRFAAGVQATIDAHDLPWSISQLGARCEYTFASPAPRTGTEAAATGDEELAEYLHLYAQNRGVLITPFHNMALMCPTTTAGDVDRHTEVFAAAVAELLG